MLKELIRLGNYNNFDEKELHMFIDDYSEELMYLNVFENDGEWKTESIEYFSDCGYGLDRMLFEDVLMYIGDGYSIVMTTDEFDKAFIEYANEFNEEKFPPSLSKVLLAILNNRKGK